ncbi:hypothetical protein ACFQ3S_19245 [Mucilaginibacter terrae]|uniref:hypothetical protein n=1 Tax=Mucilaginibacter terrae TaxID=1955052 RepID=UPI00364384AA
MIREIVKPEGNTYLLQLPDEMIGKTVEVIAFEIEEKIAINPKKSISELRTELDGLTVDMKDFKFDRNEANNYE